MVWMPNPHDPWGDDIEVDDGHAQYDMGPQALDDFDSTLSRTDKEVDHHLESDLFDTEDLSRWGDPWWRLNNLYYIINKFGQRVLFKPNSDQRRLYNNMWFLNLILKARQRGFTTFIDLWILDRCLFNFDIEAGIIAHNREDVSKIFRRKILYPYENLPEIVKAATPVKPSFINTKTKSKTEIEFQNNSIVSVGTSMRSGTLNVLHVSEFGKICARYPEKAREVVTGAFPAVHTQTGKSFNFVESTAEGRSGYFFDYCQDAQKRDQLGRKPTKKEFKFHFYPWWDNTENESDEPIPINALMQEYFEEVEVKIGQKLRPEQKYWYIAEWKLLGDDMKRENPSTPEEAFEQAIKGAYFTKQFQKIRKEKRICSVPYQSGVLVRTWWDLGMNDLNAIWFTQDIGREVHVIDYHEASGEGFPYYVDMLNDKDYKYAQYHNGPHDIAVRELGTGKSRWEQAAEIGLYFNKIQRPNNKMDSINAARRFLGICWFDEEKCGQGIERLEAYRKKWNENLGVYENKPLHDINSNGADAFQTLATGHDFKVGPGAVVVVQSVGSGGWT